MRTLSLFALLVALIVSGCDSVNYTPESDDAPAAASNEALSKGQSVEVDIFPCSSGLVSFIVDLSWKPGGATAVVDLKADFGSGAVSPSSLSANLGGKSAQAIFNVGPGVSSVEVTEVTIEFRDGAKVKTYTGVDGQIKNNTQTCSG